MAATRFTKYVAWNGRRYVVLRRQLSDTRPGVWRLQLRLPAQDGPLRAVPTHWCDEAAVTYLPAAQAGRRTCVCPDARPILPQGLCEACGLPLV